MWKTITAFAAVLVLGACSRQGPAPAEPESTAATAPVAWSDFVTGTLAAYYEFNPEQAVEAGKHEFDGRASDLSLAAADKYGEWLDERIAAAGGYESLDGIESFERDYVVQALRGIRFNRPG